MDYEFGFYWVWFYNHDEPRLMKFSRGGWEMFRSDGYVNDEIDFTDRTPQRIELPS